MKKYCVYIHINKINGKIYVGQTCQNLKYRWRNGEGYKGTPFYKAIVKYGWDNFEHIVIADNLSVEEANTIETMAIKKYKSLTHENGYNTLYGGDNRIIPDSVREKIRKAHIGITHACSDETKAKISKANRNRVFSAESRKRMSEGQRGKKQTEATKRKHSEQLKREWADGIRKGSPSKNKKPIIAIDLKTNNEVRFESVTEASEKLQINRTYISAVLNGIQKTTKGYTFKFWEVV